MKKLITILCVLMLGVTVAGAQSRDDEVAIETCTDIYEFKLNKGNVVVNNKVSTQYVALREYDCKIQPSIFYGDNIKFVKSSCSGRGTAEHKSITPDNVFYDDSRACYYNYTLNRKHKKCDASFERKFTDVNYFTRVPLADEYYIRSKTVKFIIPDEVGTVDLIPKNFTSNIAIADERDGNKRIVTYTITGMPAIKSESHMPTSASIYPMVLVTGAFKSIDELYGWSHQLAQVDTTIPSLSSILAQIGTSGTDIDKIARTQAWVQSNIRYVAFESGIGRHQPDTPAEVVRKRYADCKGLALLLKTLLVAQGIDARLTFLGTHDVTSRLSEVAALCSMNHVICTAMAGGKTYYLDATNNYIPITHIPGNIQGVEALIENGSSYTMTTLPVLPPTASCDSVHLDLSLAQGNVLTGNAQRMACGDMKEAMLTAYHEAEAHERTTFAAAALNDDSRSWVVDNAHFTSVQPSAQWATITGTITDANSVTSHGDELYIELDPDILMAAAPIDTTKRQHDYMLPMVMRQVSEVVFTIPAGYKVESLSSSQRFTTPVGTLECSFTSKGSTVVFTKAMTLQQRRLERALIPAWNSTLRQWNDASHEQLVLKRTL